MPTPTTPTTSTKSHTTSRSFTYTYVHHSPSDPSKPTILFLHGFPSGAHDWAAQIQYFTARGYGALAPNLLGFGGTAHPLDLHAYEFKAMATDVVELLDRESIPKVVGVAHDWGSSMLSRLVNYFPDRFTKVAFLDVGYTSPGMSFSTEIVGMINGGLRASVGFEIFGYFLFMDEEGAGELMDQNPLSVMSLFYSNNAQAIKDNMGATGGFRKWVEEGKIADWEDWVDEDMISKFKDFFSPANGGFSAAKNWYSSQLHNVNEADEKELPQEAAVVKQPTLMITSDNIISSTADFAAQMKQNVPDLTVKKLSCGHWVMLEKKEETNELLREFIEG
ncbi:hypothetical protein ACMFMG_000963 [Clarireedia jacksonii]